MKFVSSIFALLLILNVNEAQRGNNAIQRLLNGNQANQNQQGNNNNNNNNQNNNNQNNQNNQNQNNNNNNNNQAGNNNIGPASLAQRQGNDPDDIIIVNGNDNLGLGPASLAERGFLTTTSRPVIILENNRPTDFPGELSGPFLSTRLAECRDVLQCGQRGLGCCVERQEAFCCENNGNNVIIDNDAGEGRGMRRGGNGNRNNGLRNNNNAIIVANGNGINGLRQRRRNNVGPIVVVNNPIRNDRFFTTFSPFVGNAFINTRRGAGQFCTRNRDCDNGFSCVIDPDCNDITPLRNGRFRRRRRMSAGGRLAGLATCDRVCVAIF